MCWSQSQDNWSCTVFSASLDTCAQAKCLHFMSNCSFLFIKQFGNGVGKGLFRGKTFPTYVYPHSIKTVVREVIGGDLGDYPDPEGPAVCIYLYLKIYYPVGLLPVFPWVITHPFIMLCSSCLEYWYNHIPPPLTTFYETILHGILTEIVWRTYMAYWPARRSWGGTFSIVLAHSFIRITAYLYLCSP